jgi:hypothetical protein
LPGIKFSIAPDSKIRTTIRSAKARGYEVEKVFIKTFPGPVVVFWAI